MGDATKRGNIVGITKGAKMLKRSKGLASVLGHLKRAGVAVVAAAAVSVVGVSPAWAGSPVQQFSVTPSTTQAGGHPDLTTVVSVETASEQTLPLDSCNCQDPKDISVHLPPGVIGVPDAMPKCSDAEFGSIHCSPDSQVGVLEVLVGGEEITEEKNLLGEIPVYNLVPHPGDPALLGANLTLLNSPIYFVFSPRTGGDYGLDEHTENIAHPAAALHIAHLEIWGVPADPIHREQRQPRGCNQLTREHCLPGAIATTPLVPFTINPTTCGEELASSVDVLSYDREFTHGMTTFPATTGCDQLSFNPSLFAEPTASATDSASGIEIHLQVPQDLSPATPSPSEIRMTTVTLPEGLSINANAADGKEACSDAQARFGTEEEAHCPENSKIGTLSISTPTLPGPLPGFVYLGEPKPGERYRLVLVANGFNVHVKLPGSVSPDPTTGQLTVSFRDLPQFPFSDFNMHFFGAERGTLATPTNCGTYPVDSTFTPWDSLLPEQTSVQYFLLNTGPEGGPCPSGPRTFNPSFEAGVTDKTAGKHAPFVLKLTRADGDQNLSALNVTTPPGFSADLSGIPYCPEAAIAQLEDSSYSGLAEQVSSACPAASQVGTVIASAGAGTHPLNVSGKAYLAGPYKGAPLSFEVVIPAVSGPYDLGNVAVRSAVHINPTTAQVTATSDPFPQIIGGIPLRTRSIQLQLDRQDFALNPTNCNPFAVAATVFGDRGAQATRSTPFQVSNCRDLAYGPKLKLHLTGGLNRLGHPAIHARFTARPGEANSQTVSLSMPEGELLDNGHIGDVCTRVQFAKEACPSDSVIGVAEATTPLLGQPLSGKVYLRSSPRGLPNVVADLRGQIDIELVGRVDTVDGGRLRTTFEEIPDAPVSSFALNLAGGEKGLLQNEESLCGKPKPAIARMTGQNGKKASSKVSLNPACGKARHKRHLGTGHRRSRAVEKGA